MKARFIGAISALSLTALPTAAFAAGACCIAGAACCAFGMLCC